MIQVYTILMVNYATKVLAQPNAVSILVALYDKRVEMPMTVLWADVGSGYNAIKNEAVRLQAAGLIEIEVRGKINVVALTPTGKTVASSLKTACEKYQEILDRS